MKLRRRTMSHPEYIDIGTPEMTNAEEVMDEIADVGDSCEALSKHIIEEMSKKEKSCSVCSICGEFISIHDDAYDGKCADCRRTGC
jgi:hypothetical protein